MALKRVQSSHCRVVWGEATITQRIQMATEREIDNRKLKLFMGCIVEPKTVVPSTPLRVVVVAHGADFINSDRPERACALT